jgi:purine-nucleoside phosphorylase
MGEIARKLEEAVSALREGGIASPAVGVVLGSGLGAFANRLEDSRRMPYAAIPHFPVSRVVGHAGELVAGLCGGVSVAVLSGRVHYYEGWSISDVVFAVRVLARLGAHAVVLTNAAGGINEGFSPGNLMLISDHINAMGANPLFGANDEELGPRFPDMSEVYSLELRSRARDAARDLGLALREGVYVGLSGPSYETPAEIRMWRTLGADAVGMSTVPESIALRHMGVAVLGVSCITNMAAGILARPLDHQEVLETTRRVGEDFIALLEAVVPRLAIHGEFPHGA